MYYMDWTYILVLIGAAICLAASGFVKSTYSKYSRYNAMCGMTGAQVATKILKDNGITGVKVSHVSGNLTDNYNPSRNTVFLSDATYDSTSVAAISVAAHECGHVLQHYQGYTPIKIRSTLVPAANIGSRYGVPMIIIGIILGGALDFSYGEAYGNFSIGTILIMIGMIGFALGTLFQLVTLPVEFDASARALRILENSGILRGGEVKQGSAVLRAAALTYVAAAASSILQLIRLIILSNRNSKRRN